MSFELDGKESSEVSEDKHKEILEPHKVDTTEKLDETKFDGIEKETNNELLNEDKYDVSSGENNEKEMLDENLFFDDVHEGAVLDKSDLEDEIDSSSWSDILVPKFIYDVKANIDRYQSMKLSQSETHVNGEYLGTPRLDSPAGHWTGVRGDSKFITNPDYIPQNSKMNPEHKTYAELGISEVSYKKGDIQLTPFAVDTEKINMTENRSDNFKVADAKFADKQGMTISEAKDYRIKNNLTWHERQDMRTIDLVPTAVNGTLRHTGGVSFISRDLKREEQD
ncbi:hypothetical protein DA798_11000 [Lactobacillus sp. PFC-70]|nr:hypothetical protein DA798_11000 [Lactobacillus sp. PFC-70]